MKKIVSTLALFTLIISHAQDIKTTIIVDSAQVKMDASTAIIKERKDQLKSDRKDQNELRRKQENADKQTSLERQELARQQKQLKNEQREIQKANRATEKNNQNINDVNKLAIKLNQKLIKANDDLVSIQAKFEKAKSKNELTPVETSEFEYKITKKQLKARELEELIAKNVKSN